MEAVWIKLLEQLPTLLHSAGNQMYTCDVPVDAVPLCLSPGCVRRDWWVP